MPKLMFAWLGSGRTRRRNVAPATQSLDAAARAGLPVAPGAVLLDEFFRLAADHHLLSLTGEQVVVTEPEALWATIFESAHLPRFDRPVEVRPATASGDAWGCAAVDSADAQTFAQALAAAWSAASGEAARRDVVLLETVDPTLAGTAVSNAAATEDQVWTASAAPTLGEPRPLPRLSRWQLPDDTRPDHEQRLQMLLRGVRHSLGRGDWLIAWADDGQVCWLRGVSRLTEPPA